MSRYRKSIMYIFSAFVILAGSVCSNSFVSNAADYNFSVEASEPSKDGETGYITLLLYNSDKGSYFPYTYAWSVYATVGGVESPAAMDLFVSTTGISFTPYGITSGASGTISAFYSIMNIDSNGIYRMLKQSNSEPFNITWSSNITCHGYQVYGNGYVFTDWVDNKIPFMVNWSTDDSAEDLSSLFNLVLSMKDGSSLNQIEEKIQLLYQRLNVTNVRLQSLLDSLENFKVALHEKIDALGANVSNINDTLTRIDDKLSALGAKVNSILEEEKKQTSWLEKIWNSIQDLLGLEGEHTKEDVEVDGSEIGNLEEAEDNLLQDTEEYEASLKVTIGNAFDTITNLVTRFVNIHPDVFSFFITMLTLGTVALILGR